jgi:hypothetical protein
VIFARGFPVTVNFPIRPGLSHLYGTCNWSLKEMRSSPKWLLLCFPTLLRVMASSKLREYRNDYLNVAQIPMYMPRIINRSHCPNSNTLFSTFSHLWKKCTIVLAMSVCPSVRLSVRPWLHVFVDEKMRILSLTAVSAELCFLHVALICSSAGIRGSGRPTHG